MTALLELGITVALIVLLLLLLRDPPRLAWLSFPQ